jgi:hypothetical protein
MRTAWVGGHIGSICCAGGVLSPGAGSRELEPHDECQKAAGQAERDRWQLLRCLAVPNENTLEKPGCLQLW